MDVLHVAIKDALKLGAVGFDAIKHLVLCRVERRPPRLDLDVYPFLPSTTVATTSAASYMSLLDGGGGGGGGGGWHDGRPGTTVGPSP